VKSKLPVQSAARRSHAVVDQAAGSKVWLIKARAAGAFREGGRAAILKVMKNQPAVFLKLLVFAKHFIALPPEPRC
jgi:hypothetical protein